MKRLILTALLTIACFSMSGQNNVFPRLEKTRADIIRYFKENTISASTDEDGIISFKSGEHNYCLECSEESDELIFVKLSEDFPYDSLINESRIKRFSEEFNYKTVKLLCNDSGYTVRSEFMYDEIALFKMIYPRVVKSMTRAESMLKTKCSSYSREAYVDIKGLKLTYEYSDSVKILNLALLYAATNATADTLDFGIRIYKDNHLVVDSLSVYNYTRKTGIYLPDSGNETAIGEMPIDEGYIDTPIRVELWKDDKCLDSQEIRITDKTEE